MHNINNNNFIVSEMQPNTFDEVLGLEEQFYNDGLKQGLAEGIKAGQIEGRTFGLEKGFEKYLESGRLHGRSLIWANRMPDSHDLLITQDQQQAGPATDIGSSLTEETKTFPRMLPSLSQHQRLSKHLKVLYALSESDSLSIENTEEAVSDFDDRLKRARGKARIIERMVGECREDVDGRGQMENGSTRAT